MNSIRCSRATTALLFVAVLLAAVGTAGAISVSQEGLPSESLVGDEVTVTYTIQDPFTDAPNNWTLSGATELENVRWTVTVMRAGTQVSEQTYSNQTFDHSLAIANNGDEVVVELDGTTPAVENYTYSSEETFHVASLTQATGNNTEELANDSAHHYTTESKEARAAIEDANAAIEEAGGNEEAEQLVENAISSYEAEDFENAVSLANQAQEKAEAAQQSQQTTQTLLLVAGAVVLLALLGGGIYYWRSQQETYSKL